MFCEKCGKELDSSEAFCSNCGAPADGGAPKTVTLKLPKIERPRKEAAAAKAAPAEPTNLWIFYIAAAALHLLQLIFWFVDSIKASAGRISETASLQFVMKEGDMGAITIITVIMDILAIALCVLPFLLHSLNKRRRMVFPMIATIWSLGWLLLYLIIGNTETRYSYSLAAGGVFYCLFCVATIVVHILILVKSKQFKKKKTPANA